MSYLLLTDAYSDGGWYYGPVALSEEEKEDLEDDCREYNSHGEAVNMGLAEPSSYVDTETINDLIEVRIAEDVPKCHSRFTGIICSRCVNTRLPVRLTSDPDDISEEYVLLNEKELERILCTPFSFHELPTLGYHVLPATRRLFQKPLLA